MKALAIVAVVLMAYAFASATALPRICADLPPIKNKIGQVVMSFVKPTEPQKTTIPRIVIYKHRPENSRLSTTVQKAQ